jgi:hypothetical protein
MPDEVSVTPKVNPNPISPDSAASKTPPPADYWILSLLLAGGLFASFFMPWVTLIFAHPSGYDLQQLGDFHKVYWCIPAFAGISILATLFQRSHQRTAAQIAGLMPFLLLLFWVLKAEKEAGDLLRALNSGAYVALACGLGLMLVSGR